MKIKNKILSITIKDGKQTMEVEWEKEPTEEEKEKFISYFKNNPYWVEIKE